MINSILLAGIALVNVATAVYFQVVVADVDTATMHYAIAAVMVGAYNMGDNT